MAVLYFVLFTGGASPPSAAYEGYRPPPSSFSSRSSSSMSLQQAYLLGHADGEAGAAPDWPRHAPSSVYDEADDEYTNIPQYSMPAPSSGGGGVAGWFSFGKLFTVGLLAKQLHGLGAGPGGGWSWQQAVSGVRSMGAVQQGFMGLMVLRLFGMSPI